MTRTYAFTRAEAEPVLMQAVRWHFWQDPGEALSGREPPCDFSARHHHLTGTLPPGMYPSRYLDACANATSSLANATR